MLQTHKHENKDTIQNHKRKNKERNKNKPINQNKKSKNIIHRKFRLKNHKALEMLRIFLKDLK